MGIRDQARARRRRYPARGIDDVRLLLAMVLGRLPRFSSDVVEMRGTGGSEPVWVFGPRRGLAAPVSMLLILFSLTLVSTIAYTYSLSHIENRKEDLKLYAAEEKMLDVEEAVSGAAWSPGSARTLAFSDYGGQLRVEPSANHLQLNVSMGGSEYTLFDSDTGRFVYGLPSTVVGHFGKWLRGDLRSIVNQSSAYQALMRVETGDERQELTARYRPLVSSSLGDLDSGRRVNHIRIYVVNLNASQAIESGGEFHIRVLCDNVTTRIYSYDLDPTITKVSVTADLDGVERTVEVPLTVGASGSTVSVEVVVSSVKIEGVRI